MHTAAIKVHHRREISYNVNGVSFVVLVVALLANASAEFPFPVIHTNCESLKVAPIQSETDSCGSERSKKGRDRKDQTVCPVPNKIPKLSWVNHQPEGQPEDVLKSFLIIQYTLFR